MNSPPFDIGNTTKGAFDILIDKNTRCALNAKEMAKKNNIKSQSNGALMRCTPMAVWTSNLKDDIEIKNAISEDVEMSHPNQVVVNAVFLYSKAIHYLINNPSEKDRNLKAFNLVLELSQTDIANARDNGVSCNDMFQDSLKLSKAAD